MLFLLGFTVNCQTRWQMALTASQDKAGICENAAVVRRSMFEIKQGGTFRLLGDGELLQF